MSGTATNAQAIQKEFLEFGHALADASGEILRTAFAKAPVATFKGDKSPVTETDCAIERMLRDGITKRFPDHGILGEEFGSHNLDAEFVWVLDPIDGTMPFILGLPVFGTLIGVTKNQKPWIGIANFPVTNERWSGVSGQFAKHNETLISTRKSGTLEAALLTNSSPDFFTEKELRSFKSLCARVHGAQYGGSCMSYCALASGHADISVDGGLDAHDLIALVAIIEGAGGIVTDWQGDAITLNWQGQVLASGNKTMHEEALKILSGS